MVCLQLSASMGKKSRVVKERDFGQTLVISWSFLQLSIRPEEETTRYINNERSTDGHQLCRSDWKSTVNRGGHFRRPLKDRHRVLAVCHLMFAVCRKAALYFNVLIHILSQNNILGGHLVSSFNCGRFWPLSAGSWRNKTNGVSAIL